MQQVASDLNNETRSQARQRIMSSFYEETLQQHLIHESILAGRVNKAARSGRADKARRAKRNYMHSPAARFVAAHQVNRKRSGNRTKTCILRTANTMDVLSPSATLPRLVPVEKSNGEYRQTYEFSFEDACRHQVIVNLLRHSHAMPDFAYGVPGKGTNQLVSKLVGELKAGAKFLGHLDIRECFDSFTVDNLSEVLKLPQAVVDATVCKPRTTVRGGHRRRLRTPYNCGRIRTHYNGSPTTIDGLQGLPQGSAVSNVVATLALSDIGTDLPRGVRLFVYCDDFFLTGHTRKEVSAGLEYLHRVLENHPCGPLMAGCSWIKRCDQKLPVLGYIVQNRTGQLSVRPSGRNKLRFWRQVAEHTYNQLIGNTDANQSKVEFISGWLGNFSETTCMDGFRENLDFYLLAIELLMHDALLNGLNREETIQLGITAPARAHENAGLL